MQVLEMLFGRMTGLENLGFKHPWHKNIRTIYGWKDL